MSEPLDRARRVVLVGAIVLALVLAALGGAAWRLVEAEEEAAAARGRSAAAAGAEDLGRALVDEARESGALRTVLDRDGALLDPPPPRRFDEPPPMRDAESAFLLREASRLGGKLERRALRLAARSADPGTALAACAAGARLELAAAAGDARGWAEAAPAGFPRTRDGLLLHLLKRDGEVVQPDGTRKLLIALPDGGPAPYVRAVLDLIGSQDEDDALSMFATVAQLPFSAVGIDERRRRVRESLEVVASFRESAETAPGRRLLVRHDASAVVAMLEGERWKAGRLPAADVQSVAHRILANRGLALVAGRPASLHGTVPLPGGAWSVAPMFASAEATSRATLLLAGLGVAAAASLLGFGAFARAAHRDARLATLRTEFVATVSHELRTPVAVVRTAAETLAAGRAAREDDRRALTDAIVRESERLSSLVGNVLDFARMEAGRWAYSMRDCDLAEIARDAATRFEGIEFEPCAALPPVSCDADAIRGVLLNLLDNARKFSPPGERVTLRLLAIPDGVAIEVEDHGVGVPAAEKPHVFERFFRGGDPRVRETRGAGIGLALVRHAAEAHGGRVRILDTPGGGATFRVELPLTQNG